MSDRPFFDTNVLVYVVGQRDDRTAVAEALVMKGGVVSVQILNELASVARRKLDMRWDEVGDALAAIRILCPSPVPITIATHEQALRIAADYGYHIYDALVAAAALEAGCTILYSEDFQNGQLIDERLVVRNPFTS